MKLPVHGTDTAVEVSDDKFGVSFNQALVHQVLTAFRAGGRAGTKAQKTRAEVRGGGAKPWKQKGGGQARAGTSRGPIWVGGGRAFAAKPRDFDQKVNRKMYRAALRGIVSELIREDRLMVVSDLSLQQAKTRELAGRLRELGLSNVLILVDQYDEKLLLAARNIPHVEVLTVREIDPLSMVRFKKVLATSAAVSALEERLS